jgi:hypothetical protein
MLTLTGSLKVDCKLLNSSLPVAKKKKVMSVSEEPEHK